MTIEDTTTLPVVEIESVPVSPSVTTSTGPALPARLAFLSRLAAVPRILTFAGLAVVVIGFVLLTVAWGQVASRTQVSLQLPYIMSAGIVGLGVIMVGLTLIAIDAKLADARARREQSREMVTRLEALVALRDPR